MNDKRRSRPAHTARLTVASRLGRAVDGAWWPRTKSMGDELPELVTALRGRLGEIVDISVNWSEVQTSPDLNSFDWQRKKQRVMTITGRDATANLLVVPYLTSTALAIMVLRQAAALPIDAAHCETKAFRTAECIVSAARAENASQDGATAGDPAHSGGGGRSIQRSREQP